MENMYDVVASLCKEKGNISISKMCKDTGVSRGTMTDLKMRRTKSLSIETVTKIANYFNVSSDYLLGKTDIKNTPSKLDEELEGVEFALWGEVKEMTEAQKQDVLNFAKFIKNQNLNKEK